MLKTITVALLSFSIMLSSSVTLLAGNKNKSKKPEGNTGTLEKMMVSNGRVSLDLDLNRINGTRSRSRLPQTSGLSFNVDNDSFFTVVVFNDELRGPLPSSLKLVPQVSASLPSKLSNSYQQLIVESMPPGGQYEFVIRDGKTGFVFFNIEGQQFNYDAASQLLNIQAGRVLISKEFANELRRPSDAGAIVGQISISTTMKAVEISEIVEGDVVSNSLPAANAGNVPGPDVIVGDVFGLAQFGGSNGTQVGLALGTTSCNLGTVDLNWFQLPSNDHPVIPQNLYRMSGGTNNDERIEQVGQSSVKHAFTALTQNLCNLGCNGVGGTRLGSGCSDPYSASLNSGPNLGSRAWINPFSGVYPRGDSATSPNLHNGHSHNGTSHRILTEMSDLNTSLNQGATYFAEGQYVTPHEYAWCQTHPGECNMNNNISYRQYSVNGTGSPFSFTPVGETVRTKSAIQAWTGASFVQINPDPNNDGIGTVAYKVTNPSPGVWHYEYAVYNQDLDRAIQSFGVPVASGVTVNNIGFHAPPQQPGWAADGTLGDAGFSNASWTQSQVGNSMTWSSETLAQNPNANAIRWGTMYNFRFDSNRPPQNANATIGFYKTGQPITVQVMGPSSPSVSSASVSGRVTTSGGLGVSNARVSITDSNNNVRLAVTTPFGYYSFDNVATGATYTVAVQAKRFTFTSQTVTVSDNLTNLDFVAQP